jgi:hypothetical protein
VTERLELHVDPGTALYLRNCAHRRGESLAVAAAGQLRRLAQQESAARHAEWLAAHPTFFEDAEAERIAAGAV